MSDNFLYSEATEDGYTNVVTAEDLNNIAIDLGASEYTRFPEEPPQSAVSALNGITQDLTSKGILQIGSKCEVTCTDGIITVADGVCVFESGAKKRITEPVTLTFIEGSTNYVYMLNNISGNQIQLITAVEAPAEDTDHVMLAQVNTSGSVSDKRYWSVSKNARGINTYSSFEVTLSSGASRTFAVPEHGASCVITSTAGSGNIAMFLEEGVERGVDVGSANFYIKKENGNLHVRRNDASSLTVTRTLYVY